MEPKVLLIIINYNGINFLGECLDSIFTQSYKNIKVLVVDNNSKDGSVQYIKKNYTEVDILQNLFNKGYGDAINKAVRYGMQKYPGLKYFGILNNDLRLDENWLEKLVSYGDKRSESGVLGGKMLIYHWPKYINSTGSLVNYFGSGWDRDFFEIETEITRESGHTLAVSGGAMLIKKEVFLSAGFFDTRYFMYYEDIDFCFKVWKYSDYTVDYVSDALVYHKFSSSSGILSLKKHFYLKRARFVFILKNYPLGFLRKMLPEISRYETGYIMKDLLSRYDLKNFWREFYIYLIFLAKLPIIIGTRILKKDNKKNLRTEKAMKMWSMVSTTTKDSGRKQIPMYYLDTFWNKYEKFGVVTNRLIMGINDTGLRRGWKSLITKGYPRGRFFFNYADLVLTNPYRGDNHDYYFQLQYFLYDRKQDELFIDIEGTVFNIKLNKRMNTAVLKLPQDLLKDKGQLMVKLSFDQDFLKNTNKHNMVNKSSLLEGKTQDMNNKTFIKYTSHFKDLFVIEVSILSDDSQYLRHEFSLLEKIKVF